MRQTWRGMIIGALAGAVVGLALEAFKTMTESAARAAREARVQAPGVAHEVADLAERASQSLRGSELADRAVHAAHRVGEQIKSATESGRSAVS
ncbi:MAG: hypothetical protein QOE87_2658 [Gaiellales bacterium]|nr:hypothetical protein [Gaiellales bacterium]